MVQDRDLLTFVFVILPFHYIQIGSQRSTKTASFDYLCSSVMRVAHNSSMYDLPCQHLSQKKSARMAKSITLHLDSRRDRQDLEPHASLWLSAFAAEPSCLEYTRLCSSFRRLRPRVVIQIVNKLDLSWDNAQLYQWSSSGAWSKAWCCCLSLTLSLAIGDS